MSGPGGWKKDSKSGAGICMALKVVYWHIIKLLVEELWIRDTILVGKEP